MPSPIPKPAELRQRRNKPKSHATLISDGTIEKPRLPACPDPEAGWHNMARRFWADVWDSPMHHEFLLGDLPSLFRLAVLVDRFWKDGSLSVATEIRLMEREFGLTPLSRRRLEWQVVQTEEGKSKFEEKRLKKVQVIEGDPRDILA